MAVSFVASGRTSRLRYIATSTNERSLASSFSVLAAQRMALRPVHVGGGASASAIVGFLARHWVDSSSLPPLANAVRCACEEVDEAEAWRLLGELAERLPASLVVFVAAAAGSFVGFLLARSVPLVVPQRCRPLYAR